jgi:hypothetical protein
MDNIQIVNHYINISSSWTSDLSYMNLYEVGNACNTRELSECDPEFWLEHVSKRGATGPV